MYYAEKRIRSKKYCIYAKNPLLAYAFLDIREKVEEGFEKGFYTLKLEDTKEVGDYGNNLEQNEADICNDDLLSDWDRCNEGCDVVNIALLSESENIISWAIEKKLLNCYKIGARQNILRCRNEQILSLIVRKECSSYYFELEEALKYANPILLRLLYEEGNKIFAKDTYDRCLDEYVNYYNMFFLSKSIEEENTEKENVMQLYFRHELRTESEYIKDVILCLSYLREQGVTNIRKSISGKKKRKLLDVLGHIEQYIEGGLYLEFLNIVYPLPVSLQKNLKK